MPPIKNQKSKIKNHSDPDIRLLTTPLDPAAAIASISSPDAGGINVFLGTTRNEIHPTMGPLLHLDYHAYDEMALAELRKLADQAHAQWPIHKIAIHHRLGPVPIGQPSVIIAVSSPHRAESFAACRFLIDQLKQTVPIWKKEVYAHSAHWQSQHPASPTTS
jgi:molybdopterin synthase catalytic subunit